MTKSQEVRARMVPALEATSAAATVGDISMVPALRVKLTVGEEDLNTIGVIDTSAEFSMIDEELFKTLSSRPSNGVRIKLHVGVSRKQFWMYYVDVALLGDPEQNELRFRNVPVVAANLDRKLFVIGRRGVLDRLRLNLDFPRNEMGLILERSSIPEYPSLSEEFPALDEVIQAFDSGKLASATLKLSWDMEAFVNRIIQENRVVRAHIPSGISLGEKLRRIFKIEKLADLSSCIQEFANARNTAVHASSDDVGDISKENVLRAAENIVSELSRISAEKQAGMSYHVYKDSRGGWRWRLKASNGRIIADSSESFRSKQKCLEDIGRVRGSASASVVES